MEIQRSESTFKEDFELDTTQITNMAFTTTDDFQPSQADQPLRKKPAWMKNTRTPESASQPARNSHDLDSFRFSAEKAAGGNNGGGTPQLQTRMPGALASQAVAAGHQQQQQAGPSYGQHTGGPLKPMNGQHDSGNWQAPWQQKSQQERPYQHRYPDFESRTASA